MNCEQYQQQVSKLIDGMLEEVHQIGLFAHLSKCSECRRFYVSANRIRLSLTEATPFTMPSAVDDRVFAYLRNKMGQRLAYRQPVPRTIWQRTIPIPVPTVILFLLMLLFAGMLFSANPEVQAFPEEPRSPRMEQWQQWYSR